MNEYLNAVEKLEGGKRYTLVKYNDFGFPCATQITLVSAEVKPYAQYDKNDNLKLVFKKKGGRKLLATNIHGISAALIYEGWVDVNTEMCPNEYSRSGSGLLVGRSLMCFDSQYMDNALTSLEQKPLVTLNLK
jgi:hypothetical protein